MKKILAAASAMMLMTGAAFADSTALDNHPFEYQGEANDDLVGIFADDEGMMRTEEDFSARMAAATPEQMEGLGNMCTEMEQDQALWTDTVQSRCKMVTDNM